MPTPTPAEQLRFWELNRTLLAGLVEHGLKLSQATTPVERVSECREAAQTLAGATEGASGTDRATELAGYLADVYAEGLVPALEAARAEIPAGSPHWDTLRKIERDTSDTVQRIAETLPPGPARDRLARLKK
jgi:hypothetical protein